MLILILIDLQQLHKSTPYKTRCELHYLWGIRASLLRMMLKNLFVEKALIFVKISKESATKSVANLHIVVSNCLYSCYKGK